MAAANTLCTKCLTYYPEGTDHVCTADAVASVNQFRKGPPQAPIAPATLPVEVAETPTTTPVAPIASSTLPVASPAVSDGASASYYVFPEGSKELIDLIEFKNMGFNQANIFKAAFRLGEKDGTSIVYDLNKIIFSATRMKNAALKATASS